MKHDDWIDVVRAATQKALDDGLYNNSEIARLAGWKPQYLRVFCETGNGKEHKVIALAGVLRRLGALLDADHLLAQEFRNFSDTLDSGALTGEEKGVRLDSFLSTMRKGLKAHIVALEKSNDALK